MTLPELLLAELTDATLPSDERPPSWISPELLTAIETGWPEAYALLFDKPGRPFVEVLAPHHRKAIRWHWVSRHRLCRIEVGLRARLKESDLTETQQNRAVRRWTEKQPRYMADFPMWPRGHMKSTIARRVSVMDAVISVFYGLPGYCLYVGGTDNKTEKHAISIDQLLQQCVRPHVPALAEVQKSKEGGRTLGWKAQFFYTRAGYVFHFGSLQSGLAGGNVDDVRPTLIVLDDIDDRKNSIVEAEKNFELLTNEVLPMGAQGTLTFWAQNLINRYSCMYRVYKGHARVLTDRRPSQPVPAIVKETFKTEIRTINGIPRDVILPGAKPTWPYFGVEACQAELNRMGLPGFLRECQHEVEKGAEGLMLHCYDDLIHVISTSEFESRFGTRTMPVSWPKEWANDWARTKTAHHANVAIWRTVSSQQSPLPGFTFYFYPMSFLANSQAEDVAERILSCLDKYATKGRGTRLNPVADRPDAQPKTWAELRIEELTRANALEHTRSQLERIEYERTALAEIIPQYSEPLLKLHNVVGGVNSHEKDDVREIYNNVYGLSCIAVPTTKFGGVETLNRDLMIDRNTEHPFRPGTLGYTRTFFVVPDDTSRQPTVVPTIVNGEEREILVYPPHAFPHDLKPDDLHDDKLLRYQMVNWVAREAKITETGETIDEPLKMNDDFGNAMQMFALNGQLLNDPLDQATQFKMLVEEKIPDLVSEDGSLVIKTKQDQTRIEYAKWAAENQLREKHGTLDGDVEEDEMYYDPNYFNDETEQPLFEDIFG